MDFKKTAHFCAGMCVCCAVAMISACSFFTAPDTVPALPEGVTCLQTPSPADPSQIYAYELANGLKVYCSQNDREPKVDFRLIVRVGGSHDPKDYTGMAHYVEHLMFKGSEHLGTTDFTAEQSALARIDSAYANYLAADSNSKTNAFAAIDRTSLDASQYFIPNEYSNLVGLFGGTGINAFTSHLHTVYVCTVPKNQLGKLFALEYDRFRAPVFRGFHSELETVCEEYNMALDNPARQRSFAWLRQFYGKNHPLARNIIGYGEDLHRANPARARAFFDQYYVASNMAIVLAGDVDIPEALAQLNATFGKLPVRPVPDTVLPPLENCPPGETEFFAQEAEKVMLGWRIDRTDPATSAYVYLLSRILANGKTGLLDRRVQEQKIQHGWAYGGQDNMFCSSLVLGLTAFPKSDLRALKNDLLADVERLCAGDYPDSMLEGIRTQENLSLMLANRGNAYRVNVATALFDGEYTYAEYLHYLHLIQTCSKADLTAFARQYCKPDCVYVQFSREGDKPVLTPLAKRNVTPLRWNQNGRSAFFTALEAQKVEPIAPVFPDSAAIESFELNPDAPEAAIVKVDFTPNKTDDYFQLILRFPVSTRSGNVMPYLPAYFEGTGSAAQSLQAIQETLYRLGGRCALSVDAEETVLSVSGVYAQFEPTLAVVLSRLTAPETNPRVLALLVKKEIDARRLNRVKPAYILRSALLPFVLYGEQSPLRTALSDKALTELQPDIITGQLKRLRTLPFKIQLCAPDSEKLTASTAMRAFADRAVGALIEEPPYVAPVQFTENRIYAVNVPDLQQMNVLVYRQGGAFSPKDLGLYALFNDYYGTRMGSLTFQMLREAKSLCYSCYSIYSLPRAKHFNCSFATSLSTRNEKTIDAIDAALNLGFPATDSDIADSAGTLSRAYAAVRTREAGLFDVQNFAERYGSSFAYPAERYAQIQSLTKGDLENFFRRNIDKKPYAVLLVGDLSKIELPALKRFGTLTVLNPDTLYPAAEKCVFPGQTEK